jgi:Protein of unknown function (DUF3800)
MNYFIDECGQTGDIARLNAVSGFGNQPIFCLAAIGVAAELFLEEKINRLKEKHGIRLGELKSAARRERPEFTYEVVRLVCTERYPFFLEVVDKKYFLATHITSRQLLPPIGGLAADQKTHLFQNLVADYLFERLPDAVFAKFINACLLPSHETLSAQFSALIEFARADSRGEDLAAVVCDLVTTAEKDYEEARADGHDNAFFSYLPIPDDNKYQKPVWVLPNLSSFTNIYARINLYEEGRLSNICLIHDEQLQFDEILETSKGVAETLRERAAEMFTPHSDFNFRESASLSFASSTQSAGLQVADILAGFCMRYVKDFFTERKQIRPIAHQTYDLLRRFTNPAGGIGLNLVVSSNWAAALSLFDI